MSGMTEPVGRRVQEAAPAFDSKLIPVMREAVAMVQMILFRRLQDDLQQRQGLSKKEQDCTRYTRLAGAVVNNLYGTEPADPAISRFARRHRAVIETELRQLHTCVTDLIPFLTDSLRMQTICDNQEGIHSIPCLLLARELGLLDEDRVLPLPSAFMQSVRRLGADCGLLVQSKTMTAAESPQPRE